jgi:hypothetical protein
LRGYITVPEGKIMNREEEIRARAFELAVLSLGTRPAFDDQGDRIPPLLMKRIEVIKKFIEGEGKD